MLGYEVIDGWAALHLTVLSGAFCAVGILALVVRRNTAQARSLRRRFDSHAREITEIAGENRTELFARADDLTGRLARMEDAVRALCEATAPGTASQGDGDGTASAAWAAGSSVETEAVRELGELLGPDAYMPPLGGGGVSPDTMGLVVRAVRDRRPHLVVEVGSGASTLWLGLALRRFRSGRVVALESDHRCAELVRAMVAAHGLSEVVEVRCASDLDGLHGIDLLHVTRSTGAEGGDPVGQELLDRCAPGALVIPWEKRGAHGPVREKLRIERPDLVVEAGASESTVPARAAS
ncbi:class I SAM-dependent methyltransferase [Nocardiopsis sp. NPDC058631]|uniref:class I SAM-dependent methyltransferase n=1 Tax=Nocardiopsis sp. NPDC058631 TaxID=3346566 RepID=UPI00365AAD10